MADMINLSQGDCLELMKDIPDKSIDMVLCDPPFGTTRCKWDSIIPFEPLWEQYNRIIKANGAIVLFSQMPFTASLVMSNPKMFRYEWIAEKSMATGYLNAKHMPLKCHENICIFYKKLPTYNPQMTKGKPYNIKRRDCGAQYLGNFDNIETKNEGTRCPRDVLKDLWKPYVEELYRVLKEKSHCYIMCNNKNIYHYLDVINKTKFHYIKCLVWVKHNKIMGQSYMSQFEFIIMLRKGAHKRINYCGTSDVLVFANDKMKDDEGKTIHDTEKPVALAKVLIENSSNAGDTVLDPFMGINSTGLACKLLGRKFIGFEINKKYYDVAKERLMI